MVTTSQPEYDQILKIQLFKPEYDQILKIHFYWWMINLCINKVEGGWPFLVCLTSSVAKPTTNVSHLHFQISFLLLLQCGTRQHQGEVPDLRRRWHCKGAWEAMGRVYGKATLWGISRQGQDQIPGGDYVYYVTARTKSPASPTTGVNLSVLLADGHFDHVKGTAPNCLYCTDINGP